MRNSSQHVVRDMVEMTGIDLIESSTVKFPPQRAGLPGKEKEFAQFHIASFDPVLKDGAFREHPVN